MEHRSHKADLGVSFDSEYFRDQCFNKSKTNVAHDELLKAQQVGGAVNCSDSELCTYLLALAEGYLPTFYSDTRPSVLLRSMSIASKSFQRGKKTVVFHGFPSLQMSSSLTADLGAELLTSWLEGFPVKTSALQEKAQESTESEAECGRTWRGWLAKFDLSSCLWKTAQCSLIEDSGECLATFPRSGMTRGGLLWELPMLERRTNVTGFGFWPTPVASDTSSRKKPYAQGGTPLSLAVKIWPTPQASDNRNRGTASTPAIARRLEAGRQVMLSMCMDGPLNPDWTEWLMGWPIGHTALKPSETAKCHSALPKPSEFCLEACE